MRTYEEYLADLNAAIVLPLDAASGMADLSGQGRDGIGVGGLTVGAADGPAPLLPGGSATNFDGTDDRIEVFSAAPPSGGQRN